MKYSLSTCDVLHLLNITSKMNVVFGAIHVESEYKLLIYCVDIVNDLPMTCDCLGLNRTKNKTKVLQDLIKMFNDFCPIQFQIKLFNNTEISIDVDGTKSKLTHLFKVI